MATDLFVKLVQDRTELRDLRVPPTPALEVLVARDLRRYRFDPLFVEQDIGDGAVVRPNSIAPALPGRWIPTDPLSRVRGIPGGRLTLSSGTPVLITDVLNATKTFYTPYHHDLISIFDGNTWSAKQFPELTNDTLQAAVGKAGPAVVVADSSYDLFVWNDAGTPRLTRGPAWATDILRSPGTEIVRVQGTFMNARPITNGPAATRGVYVGTIRAGSGAFLFWKLGGKAVGGSSGYFNVWNMYNRVEVTAESRESTVSWTLAGPTALWRAINNAPNNRVSWVVGLAENPVEAIFHCNTLNVAVPYVGVGLDSTTVRWGSSTFAALTPGFSTLMGIGKVQRIGFHFFQAIEFNNAAGAALFYGDIGIPLIAQNGLFFRGKF